MNLFYFIFNSRKFKFLIFLFVFLFVSVFSNTVFASESNGTIDSTFKYAWGENIGWLNFGCDGCNVAITDTGLSGYAWSKQYGWLNLNPNNNGNTGVVNTSAGVLSGNAWGSNIGWVDFSGVTINSTGEFIGHATVKSNGSKINFNCAGVVDSCTTADFKVKTDWRPASNRVSNSRSGSIYPKIINTIFNPISVIPVPNTPASNTGVINQISKVINQASLDLLNLFGKDKQKTDNVAVVVPKDAPLAMSNRWNLLPAEKINEFVFAPLPYQVRKLAEKFPEINRTLREVGVDKLSDMDKLTGVTLKVPNLATLIDRTVQNMGVEELKNINPIDPVGLNVPGLARGDINLSTNIGTGKIALIEGLPINKFSLAAKNELPTEFVFARANSELVDLSVAMSVGEKGEVTQKIASLPGQVLKLVVKPLSKARSVSGYFVFKSATPQVSKNNILRSSLTASALFSMSGVVENTTEQVPVEKKLVLSSFEYTDPDHDGIYTADVVSPVVPGEYEVVTVIDYVDPELGVRKMSMITVIDPEGYIYEKNDGKETRIPKAVITIFRLNKSTNKSEVWNAGEYQQRNPQVTDVRGTYSFLVPEGSYYFEVEAPGYKSYKGKVFEVSDGGGVHENIELKSNNNFLNQLDYKTILLIVVLLLLMYNLYRNSTRK